VPDAHPFDNLGHIPSPPDKRDFTLKKVNKLIGQAAPTPPSYFTDISTLPVLYQGKQPACIAHATASGMMVLDNGAYSWDYSPRFLYALCKKDDGFNGDGTYYRQALKEAQQYGVCDNSQFANDVTVVTPVYDDYKLIPMQAYTTAKQRLVKSYVAVTDLSFQGIKDAIYQNKVVLLGLRVGKEMWTAPNGQTSWAATDVLPLRPPATVVSGHDVMAYGFDENYIYFRNSFGATWGANGNGMFSKNYLPYVQEGWTFMDLAPEVVTILTQQVSLAQKVVMLLKQLIGIK